jgi:hypothetical protein
MMCFGFSIEEDVRILRVDANQGNLRGQSAEPAGNFSQVHQIVPQGAERKIKLGYKAAAISSAIRVAASLGFAAAVIGRPTTR